MHMAIRSSTKFIIHQAINNGDGGGRKTPPPPVFISTNPSHININSLTQLYVTCNHSPHRFPSSSAAADVDAGKLAVAVSHSPVVVSVFAESGVGGGGGVKGLWGRVSPEDGELVGFGRAISDLALTATIFDVMVIPTLRRLGIGRMIVQRILRMLSNRGIYDISALCSEEERLFFAACGFGDDLLGSTTMTYAETASGHGQYDGDQIIRRGGRRLLIAPPSRLPFSS